MNNSKPIYLDYAAATPMHPQVVRAMQPYYELVFGNPSSLHSFGQDASAAIEEARLTIAKLLGCTFDEITFTSGGTESILLALRGATRASENKKHIITTQIEHPAVLATCEQLASDGYEVTYLPVDINGLVSTTDLETAIRADTAIISIMYANNEIGTVQAIAELTKVARKHGVLFHTDACQAAGLLNVNVQNLGVDLMSINAAKIYGPKGVGLLYHRSGTILDPVMSGGGQEMGLRGGTENVAGIVGMARALQITDAIKRTEANRLALLRDYAITELIKLPGVTLNGHALKRLPGNIHLSIAGFDGQTLVGLLNEEGICVSASSACASADAEPSHVLLAIGAGFEQAFQGLRLTLGQSTTRKEIDYAINTIKKVILKFDQSAELD